ncbi:MAG: hypothetical protein AAF558_06350 [Verrucomicrobiota bacterium]
MKGDAQEGQRFAAGCTAFIVGFGILIFAFAAGMWSTYRHYKNDPEGFKQQMEKQYQELEDNATEPEESSARDTT